ncbi:Fe-S protein maturation auxiliary factor SufT [subsurface metagenome]
MDEQLIWDRLKMCYDPEIPVNIVDLGLIYDLKVTPMKDGGGQQVNIKMTLTAPGCGMGPFIAEDVRQKVLSVPGVVEANVQLVWEPLWNQNMMSEAARLKLGML